ncbi:MAG: OmpA family protein [Leptolyngbya sp. SIO1D8]|nr:OmpA family protein [Leptolyngbya sp. SIO1D8]
MKPIDIPRRTTTLSLTAATLFIQGITLVQANAQTIGQSNRELLAAAVAAPTLEVTVNSHQDGPVQADSELTLREAIELVNGTLSMEALSDAERTQVTVLTNAAGSAIAFDLPASAPIELVDLLPDIKRPGLTIDGTTQPSYDPNLSATAEIAIPIPVVALTPASEAEVFRGLTIVADDVTVRGLSLYGFTAEHRATAVTPPADILVANPTPPLHTREDQPAANYALFYDEATAPQGVVIEDNWLGIPPTETRPEQTSAFGISVFNSQGTLIRHNRISHHDGSGIITGYRAKNLEVVENIIVANGFAGMPDGIRLEGNVDNSHIHGNLMCGNDGASIFMFKPDGAVTIANNDIKFNGQRFRRAAIYLMGNDHEIRDNTITNQKGPGVVVTAFNRDGGASQSQRNLILNNQFDNLEGLSIDLNTRRHTDVQDFQRGDGPNPKRNSHHRRQETGNAAINAPEFLSAEFPIINGQVTVDGIADPGSTVDLYLTQGAVTDYGPLNQALATVLVDEQGQFNYTTANLQPGDAITAIATDPQYGTSEPAQNGVVRSLENLNTPLADLRSPSLTDDVAMPACVTPPAPPVAVVPPPEPEVPQPLRLEVPRNIHFGLDQAQISPETAAVLDQIAAVLQAHPTLVVDLHGHTDSRASVAYNQDLALRRARNAREYLMQQGIDPARMTLRSLGETQLLVAETNRENYARNRRVEFIFSDVRGVDITFVNQETDLQIEP